MIKKHNITKKILMLLIVLLTIFNNMSYVNAARIGGGTVSSVEFPTEGTCPPSGPGSLNCNANEGWTATCYKKSWEEENQNYIYPKIWDMNGNLLAEGELDLESVFNRNGILGVLAGTYIGIDLYEEKYVRVKLRVGSTGIQEYHDCTYKNYYPEPIYDNKTGKYLGTITVLKTDKVTTKNPGLESNACKETADVIEVGAAYYECVSTCPKALRECRDKNEPFLPELNPSYKGIFQDSNDINAEKMDPLEPEVIYDTGDPEGFKGEWFWEKERTKRFSFKLGAACINIKSGDVRYIGDNGSCNPSDDEYEVKELPEYWKYFIPLNANSVNDISIILEPIAESGIVSAGTCKSIISNHPNEYIDLIAPAKGSFTGNITDDKKKVSSGCYWGMNIRIPVIQRFYNELEDGKTFKGFNFYYKPIDINEPFPNGLNDTSIWYEWNKNKINPDISESYEQLTYYANTSQNENEIRKYNNQKEYDNGKKDYPYASWEGKNENDTEGGMNKDGTSNFIDNKDIVTRRTEDFYRLGCGPKNTNANNVFTQTECDR